MTKAIRAVKEAIRKFPDKKEEIMELLDLFEAEVASGSSPAHELELLYNDLEELEHGED